MADYWKSQPRKFCDFCKCWIADNKPSVEFHEKGKRHKENVQKRIDELRKRSGEKAKEQDDMNDYLAQMERDALEAVKRDLAKDPSLAAQYGVKLKSSADNSEKENKKSAKAESSESESTSSAKVREWFEAKSPEGYSYYWNTSTNESVWEPPEDFVSLAEQEGLVEQTPEDTQQASDSADAEEAKAEEEETPPEEPPPKKKKFRVDPVGTRGAAYGAWETIREEPAPDPDPEPEPEPEPEPVPPADPPSLEDIPLPGEIPLPSDIPMPADIPLPDSHPNGAPQPSPEPIVKKERFKEKTVSSLGPSSGASVGFKKRKVASSARNARQRDNDD